MTIATRNRLISASAACALLLAACSAVAVVLIIARGGLPAEPTGGRPFPALSSFPLTPYSPLASILALALFPAFSLAALGYVMFAFEKTHTIEITFFAAFAFAISLECARLAVPFYGLWHDADFYLITISRVVYFSRFFSILAVLASGIFASGLLTQQIGPSLFLLAFFAFGIANTVPVNARAVTTLFLAGSGYANVMRSLIVAIGLLGALSYHILGRTRGISEYRSAARAVIVLLAGYAILSNSDAWALLAPGAALLAAGTVQYLRSIHRLYLWQ
ncbi:MAG TPA: hypothetical protein PLU93_04980 [Treponemataceae bacterium]|nr:hypothetical protein [Treponemataceae bacterium]